MDPDPYHLKETVRASLCCAQSSFRSLENVQPLQVRSKPVTTPCTCARGTAYACASPQAALTADSPMVSFSEAKEAVVARVGLI